MLDIFVVGRDDEGHTEYRICKSWNRFSNTKPGFLQYDEFVAACMSENVIGAGVQDSLLSLFELYSDDGSGFLNIRFFVQSLLGIIPDTLSTAALRRSTENIRNSMREAIGPHCLYLLYDDLINQALTNPDVDAHRAPNAGAALAQIPNACVLSRRVARAIVLRLVPRVSVIALDAVLRECARPYGGEILEAGQLVRCIRGSVDQFFWEVTKSVWTQLTQHQRSSDSTSVEDLSKRYIGDQSNGISHETFFEFLTHSMNFPPAESSTSDWSATVGSHSSGVINSTMGRSLNTSVHNTLRSTFNNSFPKQWSPSPSALHASTSFAGDGPASTHWNEGPLQPVQAYKLQSSRATNVNRGPGRDEQTFFDRSGRLTYGAKQPPHSYLTPCQQHRFTETLSESQDKQDGFISKCVFFKYYLNMASFFPSRNTFLSFLLHSWDGVELESQSPPALLNRTGDTNFSASPPPQRTVRFADGTAPNLSLRSSNRSTAVSSTLSTVSLHSTSLHPAEYTVLNSSVGSTQFHPVNMVRSGAQGHLLDRFTTVPRPVSESEGVAVVLNNTLGRKVPPLSREPLWGSGFRDTHVVTQNVTRVPFGGGLHGTSLSVDTDLKIQRAPQRNPASTVVQEWLKTRNVRSQSGFLQRKYFS